MEKTSVTSLDLPEALPIEAVGSPVIQSDFSLIGHVPVSLTAVIGSVTVSIEKLFSLKAGEVLEMNQSVDTPITLQVNGKSIARGELVAVDANFGICITEIL